VRAPIVIAIDIPVHRPWAMSVGCQWITAVKEGHHSPIEASAAVLFDKGYTDLLSVIPPGAPVLPSSSIGKATLGKIPGRKQKSGLWAGFEWHTHQTTADDARQWELDGANIGLRAARFPGVDIDSMDPQIVQIVRHAAEARLGPAPVRTGKAPKALMMYRTDEPFSRMRLWVKIANGEQHLVEILGAGQQYLVGGIHPSTQQPYTWDREIPAASELTLITREQADTFLDELAQLLDMLSIGTVTREGAGQRKTTTAANQKGLEAPSLEILQQALALIPNSDDLFPQRDDYIRMGYAIRAAAGDDSEAGFAVFSSWAARHESDGRVAGNPETWRSDWRRIVPPFQVGWQWIADQARGFGFNDAVLDFEGLTVQTLGTVDWHADFNAKYAIVRSVPNVILYTPAKGEVDYWRMDHWKNMTAPIQVSAPGSGGSVRQVPASGLWLKSQTRREYGRPVIDPTSPPLTSVLSPNGGEDFNLWPGFALIPSTEGSCDLFLGHIREVVSRGRDDIFAWVMMWLAAMFQEPGRLPGTALILKGVQGSGKTLVGEILSYMLGAGLSVTVSGVSELTGTFNGRLANKVLIQAEEAFFAGDKKVIGKVKTLITAPTIYIERKGIEAIPLANLSHLLVTSNEYWAVPAEEGERRMMVLEVDPSRANDRPYFAALRQQMFKDGGAERLLHYLLHEVEVDWDVISRPLATDALRDQQIQSLDPERRWLLNFLQVGRLPGSGLGSGEGSAAPEDLVACRTTDLCREYKAALVGYGAARRGDEVALGKLIAPYATRRQRRRQPSISPNIATEAAGLTNIPSTTKPPKRPNFYFFKPLDECRSIFARGLVTPPEWDEVESWYNDLDDFPPL
jgi:hypothetical protein